MYGVKRSSQQIVGSQEQGTKPKPNVCTHVSMITYSLHTSHFINIYKLHIIYKYGGRSENTFKYL